MVVMKVMSEAQIKKLVHQEVMKKTDYLENELNKERARLIDIENMVNNLFRVRRYMRRNTK